MDPEQAHRIGIQADDVYVACFGGHHNGDWLVYTLDPTRHHGRRVLTSSPNIFRASRWRAKLHVLEAAGS